MWTADSAPKSESCKGCWRKDTNLERADLSALSPLSIRAVWRCSAIAPRQAKAVTSHRTSSQVTTEKPLGDKTMNRVHTMAFRLLLASLLLWSCFASEIQAQTPSSQESTKPAEAQPD